MCPMPSVLIYHQSQADRVDGGVSVSTSGIDRVSLWNGIRFGSSDAHYLVFFFHAYLVISCSISERLWKTKQVTSWSTILEYVY